MPVRLHAPSSLLAAVLLSTTGALAATRTLAAQAGTPAPPACDGHPAFSQLDFWLGEWDVSVGGQPAGRNRIAKTLNGCAVEEHWEAAGGGKGISLFYYHPGAAEWRQVWVTDRALGQGGVKEKRRVPAEDSGAVRFQGELRTAEGHPYLDRTTLTPLPDGTVRQLIEVSADGGSAWRPVFDAIYRRR